MSYLLRLDLDRIRRNLAGAAAGPVTDDDLHRVLSSRGVWRHNDGWWGASEAALKSFRAGEVMAMEREQQ